MPGKESHWGCSGLTGGRRAGPGGILLGLDPVTDRGRWKSDSAHLAARLNIGVPLLLDPVPVQAGPLPNATLVDLPDAEHFSVSEIPDPFQRAVRDRFSRIDSLPAAREAQRQIQ